MTENIDEKFIVHEVLQKLRENPVANNGIGKFFDCESGDRLYFRFWKSKNQKRIIVGIHGLAMHSEYYVQVADQLIEREISVYALDLKNHGLSTGVKGDIKDFQELISQIHEFIMSIQKENENVPIYLMGLSMGAVVTINYSLLFSEDIKGIILISPAVKTNLNLPISDIFKLPLLGFGHLIAKGKPIVNIEKRSGVSTRNPLRMEYQDTDNLRLKKVSMRYLLQVNKWRIKAFKNASNIVNPVLIVQGTEDKLVSLEGVKNFYDSLSIQDKALVLMEGAYHSLYSDPAMGEQDGWERIISWINDH